MQLSLPDVAQFFRIHRSLMFFVNRRLGVIDDEVETPEDYAALPPETRIKVHEALLEHRDLIDAFADENPSRLDEADLEIVRSWKHLVTGKFYAFRQLRNYMVFLSSTDPVVAYGVLALFDPFDKIVGPYLPRLIKTTLLPFKGRIVYDGLVTGYNVFFGPGVKASLNEDYKEAKGRLGIVTSLPPPDEKPRPAPAKAAKGGASGAGKTRGGSASPSAARLAHDRIVALTDAFCRERLDDEYAALCRKLADILARKRPSPLPRGKPESWASGIVRAVGWVNFLGDPSQPHHMKMTDIDEGFGVSEATGSAKSTAIRDMLKINRLDPEWTLPSRLEENPLAWMIQVNGLIVDARNMPRAFQEQAFRMGLIPHIPGGPPGDPSEGRARSRARSRRGSIPSRFHPGAKVRVKSGVRDPDFPDIPLGGWAGTVKEVDEDEGRPVYLVAWGRATLRAIHPVYKKRCERDGLELETMWLEEEDLEPDDGPPAPIEQPTSIVTTPLSEKDQDDRVRLVFGLTHDDPLPDVGRETLLAYHRYLSANLKFPFKARSETDGASLTVLRLLDPEEYDPDEEDGLLCEARGPAGPFPIPLHELDAARANRKPIRDYTDWFFG